MVTENVIYQFVLYILHVKKMITEKMKRWLSTLIGRDIKKDAKYYIYMSRIQRRIDRELDNLLWLAKHYPEVFLDKEHQYYDEYGQITPHRRLKKLIRILLDLYPTAEIEFVLKNVEKE